MVNALRQLQLDDLCVHQVTLSGQCDFANSLQCFEMQASKNALWTPMINSCGISEAKRIWDSAGMTAESLCVACLFEDEALLRKQLDLSDMFGARTLVIITGGFEALTSAGHDGENEYARSLFVERLAMAAELADSHQVRLAFEPLHPMVCGFRSIVSTLQESLDILDQMDDSHDIGLAIDTYALWWEHDLQEKLKRAGRRILNYHVSDWLADTRTSGLIVECQATARSRFVTGAT